MQCMTIYGNRLGLLDMVVLKLKVAMRVSFYSTSNFYERASEKKYVMKKHQECFSNVSYYQKK